MGFQKGFFHRKMKNFSGYFWVFFSKLMQTLFWVFTRIFTRYYIPEPDAINKISRETHHTESNNSEPETEDGAGYSESFEKTELKSEESVASTDTLGRERNQICSNDSENTGLKSEEFEACGDTLPHESNEIFSNDCETQAEHMRECSETVTDSVTAENLGLEEEEPTKLVFRFQYQSWNWNYNYSEESEGSNSESVDFVNRNTSSANTNKYEFISGKSFSHFLEEPEASNFSVKELFVHSNNSPLESEAINDSGFLFQKNFMPQNCEEGAVNEEIPQDSTEKEDKEEFIEEDQVVEKNFLFDDDFICSRSESESINFEGDGFLSDTDFETTIELEKLMSHDEENAVLTAEESKFLENLDNGYEPDDFGEEEDIMEELRKLEQESQLHNNNNNSKEKLKTEEESGKPSSNGSTTGLEIEDFNGFDTLWEHQDLIEQLKMEMKKVKETGLPTILEDSESPRIMEDLKPWKIDEKFQHGSTINELPKFYRSYRERMRKFDILNYQKMYAVGFLQFKDPLKSFSSLKNSSSSCSAAASVTCILQQSLGLCRRKKAEDEPMKKFIRELYGDLEMVYVGHVCLSWEFLQWEYEKALQLWETDQYGLRRYNEVAGEFQQFQVLLQRFLENEPFQGPRVENYVRNRCAMRNLLQVPLIREDNAKDKKKLRREADKDAITSDMLVEILEESIRTIWRFIRADKDASSLTLKGLREIQVELQDPADSELLVQIRADLRKKEKRLRELLRGGSCILKKFQKHKEDETDHVLYFFSQVDMKLVWRVLNMSKITTDQLAWCRNKLNKINFVNRRIHVEPSILLFPS